MENQITEKNYPITTLWVFKAPIILVFISIVAFFFGYWYPQLVILIPFLLIINPLLRKNFHYSIGEKFFVVDQGILSKKHRNLPYGVIQNIIVKQDWFDRIFGLATLSVENAVQGGTKNVKMAISYNKKQGGFLGSTGNKVNILGLKKADAEAMKLLILKKMEENPMEENDSGL